jgi:hypothetical protein
MIKKIRTKNIIFSWRKFILKNIIRDFPPKIKKSFGKFFIFTKGFFDFWGKFSDFGFQNKFSPRKNNIFCSDFFYHKDTSVNFQMRYRMSPGSVSARSGALFIS